MCYFPQQVPFEQTLFTLSGEVEPLQDKADRAYAQ